MQIDIEKIKQRISDINESLEEIQRLTSFEVEEFWSDIGLCKTRHKRFC